MLSEAHPLLGRAIVEAESLQKGEPSTVLAILFASPRHLPTAIRSSIAMRKAFRNPLEVRRDPRLDRLQLVCRRERVGVPPRGWFGDRLKFEGARRPRSARARWPRQRLRESGHAGSTRRSHRICQRGAPPRDRLRRRLSRHFLDLVFAILIDLQSDGRDSRRCVTTSSALPGFRGRVPPRHDHLKILESGRIGSLEIDVPGLALRPLAQLRPRRPGRFLRLSPGPASQGPPTRSPPRGEPDAAETGSSRSNRARR